MKAEAETDSVRFRLVRVGGDFLFSYMVNFHTSSATVSCHSKGCPAVE